MQFTKMKYAMYYRVLLLMTKIGIDHILLKIPY